MIMATIHNKQGDNITNLREYLKDEESISYTDFDQILETSSEIYTRCLEPNTNGSVKGLIYGHIQSGKTSVILTTMALAADNGYHNFIVMTSNLNDIYEQTLHRIKGALDSFQVFGKKEFKNNPGSTLGLPLVLVSSKHPRILRQVLDIATQLQWQDKSVFIIDDEADQASLDTNINDQNKPTSAVNKAICDLRRYLQSHSYLQTTATPQSLLLQDNNSNFRPDFVVVTTPGTNYVGGKYLFDQNNFKNSDHIRLVPELDLDRLKLDLDRLKKSSSIPETVKNSLLFFFLGAAILRLNGSTKKYTYLLHTSFKQIDHHLAFTLVDNYKNQLTDDLKQVANQLSTTTFKTLEQDLQNAYDDLSKTFTQIPSFLDVVNEVARRITSTEVIEINSATGEGVSPNPARKHTLYIGGTKIGRGVTVKNLLVTYYGRDAKQPQMDTVLQHARMYGYRQSELPAIRIYLPKHLADRFYCIHASDNLVREQCKATYKPIQSIPLIQSGIRPTRRNVLNENTVNLVTYQGGKQYFPFLPISDPQILGNQTQQLDTILSKYTIPKQAYTVTIDDILDILNFQFASPSSQETWKDYLIRQAIKALKAQPQYNNTGSLVIVNRDSNLKKSSSRNYTGLGSVLPGDVGKVPYQVNPNFPAIFMTRVNGDKDPNGGWDGVPFWIPVIRFPDGNYAFSVNYS